MRILLVTARYPWPPRRGDQLRAVQALEALAGEHRMTLFAPAPPREAPPPPATVGGAPFATDLYPAPRRSVLAGAGAAAAGGLPLSSALFWQPGLSARLARDAAAADLVILQLVRLVPHLADLGEAPLLADLIDSLSLNAAARARHDRRWLAPLVTFEAGRLARAEERLIARARRALVVCERDRRSLAERLPPEAAAKLAVHPVAMAPPDRPPAAENPPDEPTVALTGNLGYFVNVDAVCWWLREVWPLLARRRPELRLVVAGARPARRVRRAVARAGGRLLVAPPDLGAVLAGATVAVAPLRSGSGVPLKVLEAWAAGVPVVASPLAAAGTTAVAGRELAVAETPAEWAATVERLLDDPAERRRLAAAGRARLAADHDPAAVAAGWRRHAAAAAGADESAAKP